MDNENNYIAESSIFSPEVIMFSEALTIIAAIWLIYEGLKLFSFFKGHRDVLTRLLSWEFGTKVLYAIITLLMGTFLFYDFREGVKFLVVIRPYFVLLSALALHRLRMYYKRDE